jgi:hypothetical protein
MHVGDRKRPPLSPKEGWISDGRHVLHFRPTRWDRWCQQLEVTVGELLPDQPVPLLKKRLEISREEALRLWVEKRAEGWRACSPQWALPVERQPRDGHQASSMG